MKSYDKYTDFLIELESALQVRFAACQMELPATEICDKFDFAFGSHEKKTIVDLIMDLMEELIISNISLATIEEIIRLIERHFSLVMRLDQLYALVIMKLIEQSKIASVESIIIYIHGSLQSDLSWDIVEDEYGWDDVCVDTDIGEPTSKDKVMTAISRQLQDTIFDQGKSAQKMELSRILQTVYFGFIT